MRRLLFAAMISLAGMFPAFADGSCIPLKDLTAQAVSLQSELQAVYEKDTGPGFIGLYTNTIGKPVPADSHPIGLAFVVLKDRVWMGLIEKDNCVRYSTGVPADQHKFALDLATEGS